MVKGLFSRTGLLIKFLLRRDRVRAAVWVLALAGLTVATASAFTDLYKTDAERQAIAETMKNPAMTAMVGPGFGLENYTAGPMMAHQMLLFTSIAAAIMSILLMARHTRNDEEEGRIELIRSLPVGRMANLTAAVLVLFAVNIVLAIVTGLGLYSLQIEGIGLEGSMLYGAAIGAAGIFFAGVTALFAQLSDNARGTAGLSLAVLGFAYLIRAIGDISGGSLSWFSPLGWVVFTEVYVNDFWFPVILTVIAGILITAAAFYFNLKRDIDSGLLPSRPGKKNASPLLSSPFAMAFRLQRTAIISWAAGMFILGVSYGSVFGDLESFFTQNELLKNMIDPSSGISLTEQFMSMLMSVISMITCIPPLIFFLRLKSEEKNGRIDILLSKPISRLRLAGSYFCISLVSSVMMQILAIFGLWLAAVSVMEDPIPYERMLGAGIVYLPAVWLMAGAAVFLLGYLPKLTGLIWIILGYSFVIVYLGSLLQFPEWLEKLSPFGYVPSLPAEEFNLGPLLLLIGAAAVSALAGFTGYRNRDLG
ncbi:ABC transporter permease [Bacillus infantis]|uniref:ABC transporter permease n=1 Tax=Bacillus infantis TaxID=324767 RepID=UPI001CD429C3|nr:ABC transporter permease [Bacillus infantis]MCA1038335.1 ABC transporter permease [Bacillus infantis]